MKVTWAECEVCEDGPCPTKMCRGCGCPYCEDCQADGETCEYCGKFYCNLCAKDHDFFHGDPRSASDQAAEDLRTAPYGEQVF